MRHQNVAPYYHAKATKAFYLYEIVLMRPGIALALYAYGRKTDRVHRQRNKNKNTARENVATFKNLGITLTT